MQLRRSATLLVPVLLLLLTMALVNLAFNLQHLVFRSDPALPSQEGFGLGLDVALVFYVGVAIAAVAAAFLIVTVLWSRPRLGQISKEALIPFLVVALALLVIGLLVVPGVENGGSEEGGSEEEAGGSTEGEPGTPLERLRQFVPLSPGAMALVLVMVVFSVVYVLLIATRARRISLLRVLMEGDEESRRELAQTVERGIYRLEVGEDVRSVVLQAYREMVEVFRARGVDVHRSLTPREVEGLVRHRLGLTGGAATALRKLFEEARYSPHEIGTEDRNEALKCLRRVKGELGV